MEDNKGWDVKTKEKKDQTRGSEYWASKFPLVFNDSLQHSNNRWHNKMKVCHREVKWTINYSKIPLHNASVRYISHEAIEKEIKDLLTMLETQGVIRRLR